MIIDKKNEPELVYGHAFDHYLVEVWNQRITYPNKIYAFDDDLKGVFRHLKYYPDITSAFLFITDNILYVALGATFGTGTSSSIFEPFERARVGRLTYFLSSRRDFLKKQRGNIDNVKFSEPPDKDTVFIQAKADKYNKGVQDIDKITYNMFVDDSLFPNTFENINTQ